MRLFGRSDDDCSPPLPEPATTDYPRFCSVCGSGLTYEARQIGFIEETGAPRFYRWAHCPKWTGGDMKLKFPTWVERAASLNADFTAKLYPFGGLYDVFYIDCRPAYVTPKPEPDPCAEPPKRRRAK